MAKKTNPTPAKTAKKKADTVENRLRRIEAGVKASDEFLRLYTHSLVASIDRRTIEQGKVLYSICRSLALDMGDRLKAHTDMLNRIERLLAMPQDVTGSPVDIKVTIPEQGLEPGNYTDASKEVADKLTAMGYEWYDDDRYLLRFIECGRHMCHKGIMVNKDGKGRAHYPQAEFLARAAVTAKALGLVAVEPEPWKPEVGELVVPSGKRAMHHNGWSIPDGSVRVVEDVYCGLVRVSGDPLQWGYDSFRPATHEDVAKYHADIEAAKPIVLYVTRVMWGSEEWRVVHGPNKEGWYQLHQSYAGGDSYSDCAKRHEFTVIDP